MRNSLKFGNLNTLRRTPLERRANLLHVLETMKMVSKRNAHHLLTREKKSEKPNKAKDGRGESCLEDRAWRWQGHPQCQCAFDQQPGAQYCWAQFHLCLAAPHPGCVGWRPKLYHQLHEIPVVSESLTPRPSGTRSGPWGNWFQGLALPAHWCTLWSWQTQKLQMALQGALHLQRLPAGDLANENIPYHWTHCCFLPDPG